MTPAIRVENLGKRYVVNHENRGGGYRTLRESIADLAALPLKRFRGERSRTQEEFWALNDVNFEVQPGEVVGIIGRNGAGKSTLLKILSRITKPTRGRVELNGRVGSLLEVGTGFHPELTGRENIFLNGSILGMSHKEVTGKFDAIVDFAETRKFLDTPVKRYSSGMYVRLAFAVASYLEPELLIVDEVLAVGDASFQRKCIERIAALVATGRTVLLVSHQIGTLQRLCNTLIYMDSGSVRYHGPKDTALRMYMSERASAVPGEWLELERKHQQAKAAHFTAIRVSRAGELVEGNPLSDEPLSIHVRVNASRRVASARIALSVYGHDGVKLINIDTLSLAQSLCLLPGNNVVKLHITALHLKPGDYSIALWMAESDEAIDYIPDALAIQVEQSPTSMTSYLGEGDGTVTATFSIERQ